MKINSENFPSVAIRVLVSESVEEEFAVADKPRSNARRTWKESSSSFSLSDPESVDYKNRIFISAWE